MWWHIVLGMRTVLNTLLAKMDEHILHFDWQTRFAVLFYVSSEADVLHLYTCCLGCVKMLT